MSDVKDGMTPDRSAARIVELLRSGEQTDNADALQFLRNLGDEAPDVMRRVLHLCQAADRRSLWTLTALYACLCLAWETVRPHLFPGAWGPVTLCLGPFAGVALVYVTRTRLLDGACGLARALEGEAALRLLAESLASNETAIRLCAARNLARLLPAIESSESLALDMDLRLRLYRVLALPHGERDLGPARRLDRTWVNYDLAVLDLLTRTADTSALPFVADLARWTPRGGLGDRARACRDYLQAVAAEEQKVAALLRPADAPGEVTLLRPAGSVQDTPPEQLLRPFAPPASGDREAT